MTDKVTCEIYLVINEDGDYEVGPDYDTAIDAFENSHGGSGPRRIVKLTAKITPPQIEDGGEIDVPDEAGETKEVETEAA
jgi:hypothetical protein